MVRLSPQGMVRLSPQGMVRLKQSHADGALTLSHAALTLISSFIPLTSNEMARKAQCLSQSSCLKVPVFKWACKN